jgi:hypothetical protein
MVEVRRDPERLLREALTGWRRVEGCDGWLLDHHATYATGPHVRGPQGSGAVPGATWLATLAVTTFRYRRRNGMGYEPVLPAGWFRTDDTDHFIWPLWTVPISANTISGVWNVGWGSDHWKPSRHHGRLRVSIDATHGVMPPNSVYDNVDLDIRTMHAAFRPAGGGPLTPVPVETVRTPTRYGEYKTWPGWDWEVPPPVRDDFYY